MCARASACSCAATTGPAWSAACASPRCSHAPSRPTGLSATCSSAAAPAMCRPACPTTTRLWKSSLSACASQRWRGISICSKCAHNHPSGGQKIPRNEDGGQQPVAYQQGQQAATPEGRGILGLELFPAGFAGLLEAAQQAHQGSQEQAEAVDGQEWENEQD